MGNLKASYIKKAIIFPAVTVAVLIIISIFAVPKIIAAIPTGTDATMAQTEYDANDYYLVEYDNFSDLRLNNFVGWISSDDIALGCALTYKSEDEDTSAASLLEKSVEPWNDGCTTIIGDNTDREFRNMHKASINHEFTIEYYNHGSYTYKIREIIPSVKLNEMDSYANDYDCVLALPFNDFSNFGAKHFYTIYLAELVDVEEIGGSANE